MTQQEKTSNPAHVTHMVAAWRYRYEPHLTWHVAEFVDQLPRKELFPLLQIEALYAEPPASEPQMTAADDEPIAWYMHLWNEADEEVKSDVRWGQPSGDDIERAEHNGHDIEHLYARPAPRPHLVGALNDAALDAACTAGLKSAVAAPGIYRSEISAAVTAYLALSAPVDFSRLYSHPLARQFHEIIQSVDNLGCDSTAVVDQIKALATAVEHEINRLSTTPDGDVTDDMLNEGQERMCQLASRTVFEDHIQAEVYKAMRAIDPAFRSPSPSPRAMGTAPVDNSVDSGEKP